ncbi:MAG: hypothetical protein LBN24_13815 [Mediterranea sp.]|jgi:hypothetical protein|nr:hypothetical protein [Mediterranea sp.]
MKHLLLAGVAGTFFLGACTNELSPITISKVNRVKTRVLLGLLSLLFSLSACSGDDEYDYEKLNAQKNTVKYVVHCMNPTAAVRIDNVAGKLTHYIWGDWEYVFETDAYVTGLVINCDDERAEMSIKVYVNGKFKGEHKGYRQVRTGHIILKGDPLV